MLCELVEMATQWPSEVPYVFRGALLEERLPSALLEGVQLVPARDLRAEQRHDRFHDGDVDHLAPPGRCRWWRADMTANAVAREAIPSARPNGGRVGGPSGSPVDAAKPLIASASVPKPGRRR